jgi:hypothetical protein
LQLSPAAQRFLFDYVHTYDELEVLLLVSAQREQLLAVRELAARLNLSGEAVQTACEQLVTRGVLAWSDAAAVLIAYPTPNAFGSEIEELRQNYADSRVPIVQAMSQNALTRVKKSALVTFAEAFRLRRPKDG